MTPPPVDLLTDAIDELYAIDAEDFMARRKALTAAARTAGDREAARAITALRKPTRSAYAINRLIRADRSAGTELTTLAAELRRGERSVDAQVLRELADRRRGLVNDLTDRAFAVIGEEGTAGLREEVANTFRAGLVDTEVTNQIKAGCLLRSVEWDGFGFASRPGLSVVRPAGAAAAGTSSGRIVETDAREDGGDEDTAGDQGPDGAVEPTPDGAEQTAARQARRRAAEKAEAAELQRRLAQLQAIAAAEQTLEDAEETLADTARAAADSRREVEDLRDRLVDAQQVLAQAEAAASRASADHREAVRALKRARMDVT